MKKNVRLQRRIDDVLRDLPVRERSKGAAASGLDVRERQLVDIRGGAAPVSPPSSSATVCRVDVPYFGTSYILDDCGIEDGVYTT